MLRISMIWQRLFSRFLVTLGRISLALVMEKSCLWGNNGGHPIKKTEQLDAEGTIKKIMTTEYVQNATENTAERFLCPVKRAARH